MSTASKQTKTWTPDQQRAIQKITEFAGTPVDDSDIDTYLYTLSGFAGTGKTTITKELIKVSRKLGLQVLCAAPTHKARKVLDSIINQGTFIKTPTCTVSALLGKTKAHSYVGTKNYKRELDTKISTYDFIFVDEVSMVSTSDFRDICSLAGTLRRKILFIGDPAQIPNPGQQMVLTTGADGISFLQRPHNPAFSLEARSELREITRNSEDNPLLELYTKIRDNLGQGVELRALGDSIDVTSSLEKGFVLISDERHFASLIKEYSHMFRKATYKVIAYTNTAVKSYNKLVREALGCTTPLEPGEILMGYNDLGVGLDSIIENGQEYKVKSVATVTDHAVVANGHTYDRLSGMRVELLLIGVDGLTTGSMVPISIFIPELEDDSNADVLQELVKLAFKVNAVGSSKLDYRNYKNLKGQLCFMDNIYKYRDNIYTERDFMKLHPLLFVNTSELIREMNSVRQTREIMTCDLTEKLDNAYPGLLVARIEDAKEISTNERLADQYVILEKDIDYGYAITAHKSQGSTYDTVFLDERNFNVLRDGWSNRQKCAIRRTLERDQLKYVAVTRPRRMAYIMTVSK